MFLKKNNVPMNIFFAIITAGEIAHFYFKKQTKSGQTYFAIAENEFGALRGLPYEKVDSVVLADFVLVENLPQGLDLAKSELLMEQALNLHLPLYCVGNDTAVQTAAGVKESAGALAEQYAMQGGNIISFGKPDLRIASYLTESLSDFDASRCLFIGDNMATDMHLANNFGGKSLLMTNGIHRIKGDLVRQVDELSTSFGLNVDYCMEKLQW